MKTSSVDPTTDTETPHFRPSLHFTPRDTWMNDPNGLVTHKGVHHMFFQNNPHGREWGNMSWGHAASSDLLHWTELPVALTGDETEGIFSGSIVWDRENTSGLGDGDEGPLVALYTSDFTEHSPRGAEQAQSVAWSIDEGRSWTKYDGNPVLARGSRQFRDPKVFWHEPTGRWVMVCVEATDRQVVLHTSTNLLDWELASIVGPAGAVEGLWECPDLIQVPIEGSDELRWVMLVSLNPGGPCGGSGMQWFLGDFDGKTFTADGPARTRWFDHGPDMYAAVSFAGRPAGARPLVVGWMSNWSYAGNSPTRPWASAMTLPRELSLAPVDDDLVLRHSLVLPDGSGPDESVPLEVGDDGTLPPHGAYLLRTVLPGEDVSSLALSRTAAPDATHGSGRTTLTVQREGARLLVDRREGSLTDVHDGFESFQVELPEREVTLQLVEDHGLVEVLLDDGLINVSVQTFPADGPLEVGVLGTEVQVVGLD
ncbi:hypothetical protein [Luteococcus sp.]|uniref:hypothetical protein n=1 Tax=Luteococcus sp. TaxID=1969402 RepID=UPI003736E2F9